MSEIKLREEADQIAHETMTQYDTKGSGSITNEAVLEMIDQYRTFLMSHLQERAREANDGQDPHMTDYDLNQFLSKCLLNANPS